MSLADEIEKLQRLRDRGAMTEEEFARAKALLLGGQGQYQSQGPAFQASYSAGDRPFPGVETINRMARSSTDRWVGGVCGGLAQVTPLPAWFWRLLFALATVVYGIGAIPYVLLWIFMPSDETAAAANKPATYHDDLA
jgi:phage shock protein PspC (stress-responsive transcriptional regulator)